MGSKEAGTAEAVMPNAVQPAWAGVAFAVAIWATCAAAGPALGGITLVLAVAAVRYSWLPAAKPASQKGAEAERQASAHDQPRSQSDALHGTFVPSTGLKDFSQPEVHLVENDNCTIKTHILTKPTDGIGFAADYFAGKRRLWEIRYQIQVKKPQTKPLVFGIELAGYVPVSGLAKRVQQMTVASLRKVVGNDLYHSSGDDPAAQGDEVERPVFVMPFWAFDQLVVSEVGQEPDLRDLQGQGILRTENRRDFIRKMSDLRMQPGKVYTFSFWCISRFVDVLNWQLLGVVPGGVDFNTFCGQPPVHMVMYSLEDAEDAEEKRHLQSRKNYFLNLALWSTKAPPTERQLRQLLPDAYSQQEVMTEDTDGGQGWCCWR